jgi:hypothetical protein
LPRWPSPPAHRLFAANGSNYDPDASANFGKAAAFATDNHVLAPGGTTAASLFGSLTGASLDWTPPAGGLASNVGAAIPIPAGYTGGYFGGTLAPGAYFGAAVPGGEKWWAGWTAYYTCTASGC